MKICREVLCISLALPTVQLQDHLVTVAIHTDTVPSTVTDIHIRQVQGLVTGSKVIAARQDGVHDLMSGSGRNLVSSNYIRNVLEGITLANKWF